MKQGRLGNCWFLSTVAAIADKDPDLVSNLFLIANDDPKLFKSGMYGVNFYTLGVPHIIIVDDFVPMRNYDTEA